METSTLLCDSFLCRLCGQENRNGSNLFEPEENNGELIQLVNRYLPLKVDKDGKYPTTICPGCNIQLEATKIFFDLIIDGQAKLRNLYISQQDALKRKEKQKQQLETALKNVNPNSSVKTFEIQSDETGEKFLIQIFSDGPLFPPDHELSLKAEGLERPKRKRGRPPKPPPNTVEEQSKETENADEQKEDSQAFEEEAEIDADGRRKRRIKAPSRFSEVLQGKELDRIFKEEGVIDDESSEEEVNPPVENKPVQDEVIGHMQDKNGEDTGQVIVINRTANRFRIKTKTNSVTQVKKKKKFECEICGRVFLHQGRLDIHKTFHKNIKYQCGDPECPVEAESKTAVEEHHKETGHTGLTLVESLENYGHIQLDNIQVQPLDEQENVGIAPSNKLPDLSELPANETVGMEAKQETKHDQKFECQICSKSFSCKQNYEVHCKAVHENIRPYQCDKCDKSFPYLNSLKCHMLQHTDKLYPCEVCQKVFNHPSSLVYHREAEHNNGRKFVCNKCKKSFKHKQLLLRHQLVHSDERPHTCKFCDASFKTRANLLNHMPTHTGEKKYFCNECGHTFAHKTSLTLHIRWHKGQKPYQCDVCMKSFSQKGNLAEHKRIHTGEKPYCCDMCGHKFTTSSQFKLHVKRHTGERPWRCEYCSKTFLHRDTWKRHTRRHRNERPYQCGQCFRGFTEQWGLRKHERLHTGEKPYQCDVCHKNFADSSNLAKHKKIHLNHKVLKEIKLEGQNDGVTQSAPGENQILYLALQDANSNDEQPQTLVHIMDNLEQSEVASVDTGTEESVLDSSLFTQMPEKDDGAEIGLNELQIQQLLDQDGNPLSIPTSNGDIKLVATNSGDMANFHGLLPDGTLIPFNINVGAQTGKPTLQLDALFENVMKDTKEDEKAKQLSTKEDVFTTSSIEQLLDTGSNLQFIEDGDNVCFVTTYNVDDTINQQYLT